MKRFISILLLHLLLINVISYAYIGFDYALNKTFIIENFCINKERPELKCDGKCYLAQQLKQAQKSEKHIVASFLYGTFLPVNTESLLPQKSFFIAIGSVFSFYIFGKLQKVAGDTFKPPRS